MAFLVGAVCALAPVASGQSAWKKDVSAKWNASGSWTSGIPNGIDASATLGNIITRDRTVTVDTNVTLGTLNIGADYTYTLLGSGGARTLTFNTSGGADAAINVSGAGDQSITASSLSLVLADNTTINQSGSGVFNVGSNISGTGGLTYAGSGSGYTVLSGDNSFSGAVTVKSGLLQLNATSVNAGAPNGLVVGDGIGAANSAIVRNMQEGQLSNTASLTVKSDGWYDINAAAYPDRGGVSTLREETVGHVFLNGGRITTGTAKPTPIPGRPS